MGLRGSVAVLRHPKEYSENVRKENNFFRAIDP